MFYEQILRKLQEHEVRYLVLGGAAVNLHGVPRMTADLDIMVDLSPQNIEALLAVLEEAGMKVSLPVNPADLADETIRRTWREKKNLQALTFQTCSQSAPYLEVDVVIEPPLDFEEMYAERVSLDTGDFRIDLVSLPHLIRIKRSLGRKQDIADAEALERIERGGIEGEQDD